MVIIVLQKHCITFMDQISKNKSVIIFYNNNNQSVFHFNVYFHKLDFNFFPELKTMIHNDVLQRKYKFNNRAANHPKQIV